MVDFWLAAAAYCSTVHWWCCCASDVLACLAVWCRATQVSAYHLFCYTHAYCTFVFVSFAGKKFLLFLIGSWKEIAWDFRCSFTKAKCYLFHSLWAHVILWAAFYDNFLGIKDGEFITVFFKGILCCNKCLGICIKFVLDTFTLD